MASQGLNVQCTCMIMCSMLCNVESGSHGSVDEEWSFGGLMFQYQVEKTNACVLLSYLQ